MDGFSFCISDIDTKKDVYFDHLVFDGRLTSPEVLLEHIKSEFKKNEHLQLDFSTVEVLHQNNLATVVPNEYFDENQLTRYLENNIKILKTDFIAFDDVPTINAKNVYVPYVNINNFMFQHFGEFEYRHYKTVLIEKLLSINDDKKNMFVNVDAAFLDIIVIDGKKLILNNTFEYETKEDFLYYILFVAEQLELETDEFPLYFTGNITPTSNLYQITSEYIKNIDFLKSQNSIYNELNIENHTHFILLG